MNENVNVCVTPKGDKPVLHFSQFDNGRIFTVTVLADDGETAAVLTDFDVEFRLRKTDSHVVTVAPESVTDNVITFKSTEQMCACCGQNIASVVLMDNDTNIISTLDILVDIQRDILSGGLTSESDIRNLTTQIEQIVPEVIGDDYYTKTEVDELIADIPTFDPTNYYDKSDVDGLLADKADSDDVYTKAETDTLLADKADIDDVMVKITRHGMLGDMSYFTFNNNCVAPMDDIKCDVTPVQSGSGTPSPSNPRPITGYSDCTITVADSDDTPVNTCTVNFGQTVYGGSVDVTGGVVEVSHVAVDLGSLTWSYNSGLGIFYTNSISTPISKANNQDLMSDIYRITTLPISASNTDWSNEQDFTIGKRGDSSTMYLYCRNSMYTDAPTFTTAMSGKYLVYALDTPTDITFTPVTTDTINGTNKVSSSTGNMKSLTYFSDVNSDLVDLIRACMI